MHDERGRTIERLSGTRAATTFRNEPSARPGANATAASAKSTFPLSAGAAPRVRDQPPANAGRSGTPAGFGLPRSPTGRSRIGGSGDIVKPWPVVRVFELNGHA